MTVQPENLQRGLGLKEATALNMIDMVGIGPFVVLPLVIQTMGGPQSIAAWVSGALLALIDGFIWAELGAAMPRAGGSYVFLREAYGVERWGKLMSFLFIWQTMFQAPLVVASGAIGFAQYLSYLVPLDDVTRKIASGSLVIILIVLLYRKITTVGKMSLLLWIGVIGTMIWFIGGGLSHFKPDLAFNYPEGAWNFSWPFFVALGQATVQTIYTYLGYYNVCHLGAEIRDPGQEYSAQHLHLDHRDCHPVPGHAVRRPRGDSLAGSPELTVHREHAHRTNSTARRRRPSPLRWSCGSPSRRFSRWYWDTRASRTPPRSTAISFRCWVKFIRRSNSRMFHCWPSA